MRDAIVIDQLELRARVGVPDEERAQPQRLTATLWIEPRRDFSSLGDAIENAVDYAQVCEAIKGVAAEKPRRLIETLAEEIAAHLLAAFAIRSVEIELRKFILPDTQFVAVRLRRDAQ